MDLRQIARSNLGSIMNDKETGFGWDISITNPAGTTKILVGRSTDISQLIDPDTGQAVSGRMASVAIFIDDLTTAGLGVPRGIADKDSKPWIVGFNDINGNPYTFKVVQSNPDRAAGLVVCILEVYE